MTVTHIVLVRWSPDSDEKQREDVRARVRALRDLVDGVVSLVEGPSTSPEGLEQGFDYGFVVTFADSDARDEYLPHPEHVPVGKLIGEAAAEVVVFDI
jgi:hypothetical protein